MLCTCQYTSKCTNPSIPIDSASVFFFLFTSAYRLAELFQRKGACFCCTVQIVRVVGKDRPRKEGRHGGQTQERVSEKTISTPVPKILSAMELLSTLRHDDSGTRNKRGVKRQSSTASAGGGHTTPRRKLKKRKTNVQYKGFCENCMTTKTPQWRKGRRGESFCQDCGRSERRHDYARLKKLRSDVIFKALLMMLEDSVWDPEMLPSANGETAEGDVQDRIEANEPGHRDNSPQSPDKIWHVSDATGRSASEREEDEQEEGDDRTSVEEEPQFRRRARRDAVVQGVVEGFAFEKLPENPRTLAQEVQGEGEQGQRFGMAVV